MESETYPDVTSASNAGTEKQALNAQIQNADSRKDTSVVLSSKRGRFHTSRHRTLIVTIIAVCFLVLAILITFFITRNIFSQSTENSLCFGQSSSSAQFQNETSTSISEVSTFPSIDRSPQQPWSKIRLRRFVKPSFYELNLRIDLTNFTYQGSVDIVIEVIAPTNIIVFHRNKIEIELSTVSLIARNYSTIVKIARQFEVPDKNFHVLELERDLKTGETYILRIGNYTGKLGHDLKGLYLSSYVDEGGNTRYLAVSQMQATDARRVFPCFDEPDFKARFKLSITYQSEYNALSNMPATHTTVLDADWTRKHFQTTPIMSTYLLAIVVSDFKSRNYTFDNGYELKVWARPEAINQTEYSLDIARKCYSFLTDYFGAVDIVPKADHVAVPDFDAGAMENWGLVVYRETTLLYDRYVSSSANKYSVTSVVAHEISHTWFGNMVTMDWWNDLWLNEGFASLLTYITINHIYPQWNVFATVIVDQIMPVMLKDALITSHPVSAEIVHPEEISQRFDSISYDKGMAVLRMLMDFAGPKKFQNGLRMYIQRYKLKNANMSQLWEVFTEAFNNTYEVGQIMDTWTRQMGYPVVMVEDVGDRLLLHQELFLLDPSEHKIKDQKNNPFEYKWYIPFSYVTEDSPASKGTVWLNLGSASIPKPTSGWLLGNYEFVGFFRVNYDKNMWGLLADQLMRNHTVITEANRAGLIGDAFALARANLLEYEVALNLTRYLKKEQSYVPWQAFLNSVNFIKGMIANRSTYIQLQRYIQELVGPIFDIVGASDKGELPERFLRRIILGLACDIGMEKAVAYAKSMFVNWMRHNTRLPPDHAALIYSVGVREGGVTEWDYVWNKSLTTNVTSESDIMRSSLTKTQKPWLLWRYINWVIKGDKFRLQNIRSLMGSFSTTPLGRMIALDFVMQRWKDIVKVFDGDAHMLGRIISSTTLYVNSEFHLQQLKDVFKDNAPKIAVENAFALIRANIGWVKDNYEEIEDWLNKETP